MHSRWWQFFRTMRATIYLIWTFLLPTVSIGQTTDLFKVSEGIITDSLRSQIEAWKKSKPTFYEDEVYLVSKTCSGEWGGTVKFKNKMTGIEYASSATCPISVNKISNIYYVTNSLGHLSGSCEVLEIRRPDSMKIFKIPPPRKIKGKKVFYVGDDESNSTKGTKKLIGNYGMLILGSFLFRGNLFHIVRNDKETYIATIENEKFKSIKFLTNQNTFTYDNEIMKTKDGHLLIPISGGYLDIFNNEVTILRHQ